MSQAIYTPHSLAELVVEADRRATHLSRAVRRTRNLIDQSRSLLAMYPADLVMGQHLARYASLEHLQVKPD